LALAANASILAAEAPAPSPRNSSAWLNVTECGASGSSFETTATTAAGSKQITVAKVGDFQVGQGVMVSRCNIRYTPIQLWGTGLPYCNSKPLAGSVELRGYDGSTGSWVVYLLDIKPSSPPAFRWSDDLARTWHPETPITHDWQKLNGGVEVRLKQRDWESGYVIAFGARDQLVATIASIQGNTLTLSSAANRSAADAVVRHCDHAAIQAAVDRAIKEKRNVYIPVGHYRLSHGIRVNRAAAIVIEGQSAVDTLFDISDGEGSCIMLNGGTDVTVRNLRMLGFMGFDERDKAGYLATRGSIYIWGFALRPCNAVTISDTERVLVENCHASRMSGECFVSGGHSRATAKPGESYTKLTTYLRCSATDCARNGFNDVLCGTENTAVLSCRIQDVGGCAWEGASRFVRFVGNYVRNAGTVAMGNLGPGNRDQSYPDLGAGQHIIADNVFESSVPYGVCAIRSAVGATQVIIRNNLFVNFGSSAVEASGATDALHFPSSNTAILGNIFDMTSVAPKSEPRTAIDISANDTTVSDNQIYVRGACDPAVMAIRLREPALNVQVHDNLIRNCGAGLRADRGEGRIAEVLDEHTFLRTASPGGLPLQRRQPEACRGWTLAWLKGSMPKTLSVIDAFDPATLRFTLREPHPMKAGDWFHVLPIASNWNIHDNTITGCRQPVVLDGYGNATALLTHNLITRGGTSGVPIAIEVRGRFHIAGNHVSGFDEKDSRAMAFRPDPLGHMPNRDCRDNTFDQCTKTIDEDQR
jgi:hypothetical protein